MRNHLAEYILNSYMLHLMELYQKNIGIEGAFLNATIELLKCTSVLVNFCRDPRPITDTSDDRLKQNHDAMIWFIQWENSVKRNEKNRNKEKCLISLHTRQDIISAMLGFEEICTHKLKKTNASIIPNRVNSDVSNGQCIMVQITILHTLATATPWTLLFLDRLQFPESQTLVAQQVPAYPRCLKR